MKKVRVIIHRYEGRKRYGYALKVKESQLKHLCEIFGDCEIYIDKYRAVITKIK